MSTTFCCSYWYISIYSEKCFDYNTHTANWVPLTSNCDIHWVIFLIWVWNHSPTSVGGIYMSVLFLYFSPQSVSTVLSLYVIFIVACLNFSSGLQFYVGGLLSSSSPPWYPCFLCPTFYFVSLLLQLIIKISVPMMFLVIPWIFVEPPSPAWTAVTGVHWLRRFCR